MNQDMLLLLVGAAVVAYLVASPPAQPAPLSIYPSLAYTKMTSMATTPAQHAPAAVTPMSLFSSVQQQEQAAILSQCAGSYPYCTLTVGDTQLGY